MERPTSSARWPLPPHTGALVCNGEHHYSIATGDSFPHCGGRYGMPLSPLVPLRTCDGSCSRWFPIKAPPWKRDSAVTPPWERG
jgi:hypothetical protein